MTKKETNLRGRLRNTSLPKSNGLFPLFEAVVNSIHSIEDANGTEAVKSARDLGNGGKRAIMCRSFGPHQTLGFFSGG